VQSGDLPSQENRAEYPLGRGIELNDEHHISTKRGNASQASRRPHGVVDREKRVRPRQDYGMSLVKAQLPGNRRHYSGLRPIWVAIIISSNVGTTKCTATALVDSDIPFSYKPCETESKSARRAFEGRHSTQRKGLPWPLVTCSCET